MLKAILFPVVHPAQFQRILRNTANLAQHKRTVARHANLLVCFPKMPVLFDQLSALCTRYFPVGPGPSGIVKRAQSAHPCPFATLFALLRLPEAFKAHLFSALNHIAFKDVFATLVAIRAIFFTLPESLIVVRAHTPGDGYFVAKLAWLFGVMKLLVVGVVFAQFKVLRFVIVRHAVSMVNYFRWLKKAANLFLYYKPVLKNVAVSVAVRMVRGMNQNITLAVSVSSAFPFRMGASFQGHAYEFGLCMD